MWSLAGRVHLGFFWAGPPAARSVGTHPPSPRNDPPLDPGSECNLPGYATQSFQIDVLQMGEHGTEDKTAVAERWALGWGLKIQKASNTFACACLSSDGISGRTGRFQLFNGGLHEFRRPEQRSILAS